MGTMSIAPSNHDQDPAERAFHRTVRAHGLQEPLRNERLDEPEEAGLRAPLRRLGLTRCCDLPDGLQAKSAMQVLQRFGVVQTVASRVSMRQCPLSTPVNRKLFSALAGSAMWSRTSS